MKRPAVFFDRDNTLIVSDGYLGDPEGVVLVDGAAELVARVRRLGYAAVTFSNQSGVARGLFTEQDVHRVNSRLDEMLLDHEPGAVIDRHEFCPHHPEAVVPRYRQASEFRKPSPGMIYQAARQLGLDLGRSWVVGDAPRDIEAGRAAGCRTILFKDPAMPASAAAREPMSVEPDFVAANLKEVGDLIENNPPAEETAEPVPVAEEQPDVPDGLEPVGGAEYVSAEEGAAESARVGDSGIESAGAAAEPQAQSVDPAFSPYIAASPEQGSSENASGLPVVAVEAPGPTEQGQATAVDVAQLPSVSIDERASQEPEQTSAAPVAAGFEEPAAVAEFRSPQPAEEQVMDDTSTPDAASSGGVDSEGAVRRRSPPAVILAAKAAREAARNSAPDASPEVLREVARNAAREAAMGITRDYTGAAPATATSADPSPMPVVATEDAPVHEPLFEATSDPRRQTEPDAPAYQPLADQPREMGAAPGGDLRRLEDTAEQILMELRRRNDAGADFSVSKLMAGITMVISVALLVYAYLYKDYPTTLQSLLLLGLMLQTITISLLIMGRQK
jgi:D-glycero-D-manno-heptose 1,7-bisphosphate phosphatase